MKTPAALLDTVQAVRTRLCILRDPLLRLMMGRITVFSHAVKLFASLTLVPLDGMGGAHGKAAGTPASDAFIGPWLVHDIIDLAVGTAFAEVPAKVGELT